MVICKKYNFVEEPTNHTLFLQCREVEATLHFLHIAQSCYGRPSLNSQHCGTTHAHIGKNYDSIYCVSVSKLIYYHFFKSAFKKTVIV